MMKDMDDMRKIAAALDRAIVHVDKFIPANDRTPLPGGGNARVTAVGFLVAARAVMEAVIEEGAKRAT